MRKALVVGGGIMGLCSAWALRRDGWSVRVLDQDPIPNPRGASVDRTRLIREAYGRHAGYMRMVDEAYEAWDLLWADLGERLFHNTGVVAYPWTESGWVADSAATFIAAGRQVTRVEGAALQAMLPMLHIPSNAAAITMSRGGILMAERIVAGLARLLDGCIERARVVDVHPARATVHTEDGRAHAGDLLVVAAGPWGPRLVPALASRVRPSRIVLAYYAPPPAWEGAWRNAPIIADLTPETGIWAAPPVAGEPMKFGDHVMNYDADPQTDPRVATKQDLERLGALIRPHVRDFDHYTLIEPRVCFYDMEPEDRFVIETLAPSCWVMNGFSGHGFKFGACLGLALARAAGDAKQAEGLAAWAAGRN